MSNYIKYLNNIEKVPNELIDPIEDIINQTPEELIVRDFKFFQYKRVNKHLTDWLHSKIKIPCYAKYQVIRNGIPIHKDNPAFPGDRRLAFNYLLQTGGDNVLTRVYDEDKTTILQEECLPLHTWHSLVVEKYHGVFNIDPSSYRVAISVTPILKK